MFNFNGELVLGDRGEVGIILIEVSGYMKNTTVEGRDLYSAIANAMQNLMSRFTEFTLTIRADYKVISTIEYKETGEMPN